MSVQTNTPENNTTIQRVQHAHGGSSIMIILHGQQRLSIVQDMSNQTDKGEFLSFPKSSIFPPKPQSNPGDSK